MKTTRISLYFMVLCAIMCNSCSQTHKVEIHCGDPDDYNSILFLVESANVETLCSPDELRRFLKPDEMAKAFHKLPSDDPKSDTCAQRRFHYKHYRTVQRTSRYTMELVLRIDNKEGRNYCFQLRTYTPQREVISILDFAVWSETEKRFTSGILETDGRITITSQDTREQKDLRMHDDGLFIIDKG